ncbi:MAG: alpha/beta hydrolase [Rhodospirillaceae bacterium]|nr:alpha/beta hydrolase [Rhodospirillaceae bacterium]
MGTGLIAATAALGSAAGAYLGLLGYLFVVQRRILFLREPERPDLAACGLADVVRPVQLVTADGLGLLAWYRPPPSSAVPLLVFLHGNAGHIGHRADRVRPYVEAGWGLLLVEYRGYGGNPGAPCERGLYADARAALAFARAQGVADGRIVLYGESLGAAVAVQMAVEHKVGALVLEAPFCSVGTSAVHRYPLFPMARWLVRDKFDSLAKIACVRAPLLVLHGERDQVTPPRFGRTLLASAKAPKEGRFYPEGGHVDLDQFGAAEAVIDFVRRRLAAP